MNAAYIKNLTFILGFMTFFPSLSDAHLNKENPCSLEVIIGESDEKMRENYVIFLKSIESLARCTDQDFLKDAQGIYNKVYPKKTKKVKSLSRRNGLRRGFKGEVKDVEAILGNPKIPGWKRAFKACGGKVKCALVKLFGNEESALRALSIARISGYKISLKPMRRGDRNNWSKNDLRIIQRAIRRLPSNFFNLVTLDDFYRYKDGDYDSQSPRTVAYAIPKYRGRDEVTRGQIAFYDKTFLQSGKEAERVVIHELAHQWDMQFTGPVFEHQPFSMRSGYLQATDITTALIERRNPRTGALEVVTEWRSGPSSCFPSQYSKTSPTEHFAESVSFYVMQPKPMKKACPAVYDFLKRKVFGGYEYTHYDDWPKMDEQLADPIYFNSLITICTSFKSNMQPMRDEQCLLQIASVISAGLKEDPTYCHRGGAEAVLKAFRERVSKFDQYLQKTLNQVEIEVAKKKCFTKKNLTDVCLQEEIEKEISRVFSKGPFPLDQQSAAYLKDKFLRFKKSSYNSMAKKLNKSFEHQKLVLNCLKAIKKKRGPLVDNLRKTKDIFYNSYKRDCRSIGYKLLDENNYQYDKKRGQSIMYKADAADLLFQSTEVRSFVNDIGTHIFDRKTELFKNCKKDETCMRARLKVELMKKSNNLGIAPTPQNIYLIFELMREKEDKIGNFLDRFKRKL